MIKNHIISGAYSNPILCDFFYKENQTKKPVIIYVHGFNGFKDWGNLDLIAQAFSASNYVFVKMNLSHNGTSISHPEDFVDLEAYSQNNYSKEIEDVKTVITYLHDEQLPFKNEIDLDKIILLGHSRGGAISILTAAEDDRVKALLTWASVSECKTPWSKWSETRINQWREIGLEYIENKRTKQLLPLHFQLYEDYQKNEKRFNIEEAIKRLNIPILMAHGLQDEAVSFDEFLKFQKWKPQATFIQVESNHTFGRVHPNLQNEIPEPCRYVIQENIQYLNQIF